jgi:hypothetical protein
MRHAAFFLCVAFAVSMSVPSLAESPDSYNSPIGDIDPQLICQPALPKPKKGEPTEESVCLAQFRGVVTRRGDDLTFKLDNGGTKVIKSNTKACEAIPVGDCIVYALAGYIPGPRQFILLVTYYESAEVYLVSRRSGAVTKLEGYPRISPAGTRFVTVAASDAWDVKSPIAIFSMTDPPKLEWRFPEPKEYEEYAFEGWDGEDRVRLRTITDPEIDTDVKRSAQGWILSRPNGKISLGTSSPPPPPPKVQPVEPVAQPAEKPPLPPMAPSPATIWPDPSTAIPMRR